MGTQSMTMKLLLAITLVTCASAADLSTDVSMLDEAGTTCGISANGCSDNYWRNANACSCVQCSTCGDGKYQTAACAADADTQCADYDVGKTISTGSGSWSGRSAAKAHNYKAHCRCASSSKAISICNTGCGDPDTVCSNSFGCASNERACNKDKCTCKPNVSFALRGPRMRVLAISHDFRLPQIQIVTRLHTMM